MQRRGATRGLFARMPLPPAGGVEGSAGYRRTLGAFSLTGIGIAAIIGAGIFVGLGEVAQGVTGPAVIISVFIAGVASVLAALVLAELAGMAPGSGGLYGFAYAGMGRLPAFLVGWATFFSYAIGNVAVAAAWSEYFVNGIDEFGVAFPAALALAPGDGGTINVPALAIMLMVTALCLPQVRDSTAFNNVMVGFKLLVVLVFIVVGFVYVRTANWTPFAPFGFGGVVAGASTLVFAYLGFDTVAAAGAEARNPRRDLPLGIVGSVAIAGILYMMMGAVVTGMQPTDELSPNAPLANAFSAHGQDWAAGLITLGALVAFTTVMYAFHLALSRILQSMADDGFLPASFARLNARTGTPWTITIATGIFTAIGAGLLPALEALNATVIAAGFGFIVVAVGVLVLKRVAPHAPRTFRAHWTVAVAAILVLGVIIIGGNPAYLQFVFLAYMGLGLVLYGFYAGRRARY